MSSYESFSFDGLISNFQDDDTTTTDDNVAANDPDYIPEMEHAGVTNLKYSGPIKFGERYNLSSYVIAMMINLTLKSTGITDPNLFVSPTGIRKMRIREGKNALEDHGEITKGTVIQGLQILHVKVSILRS